MTARAPRTRRCAFTPPGVLNPEPGLLLKLGSILVHADELASADGHPFDAVALKALTEDPQVRWWMAEMHKAGLLPKKRVAAAKP